MVLLDTHALIWLASDVDDARLSKAAKQAIHDSRIKGEGMAICDISLLEISTLVGRGRIQFDVSFETFLREVEKRFVILPITPRACAHIQQFPAGYPKDPADRIIGATAFVNEMPLITADRAIRDSKALTTIW